VGLGHLLRVSRDLGSVVTGSGKPLPKKVHESLRLVHQLEKSVQKLMLGFGALWKDDTGRASNPYFSRDLRQLLRYFMQGIAVGNNQT
jgi:hypothetical protein